MIKLLEHILSQIVNFPDKIKVEEQNVDQNLSIYRIFSDQEDVGKIIGKNGKIIQAIRNVAKILAIKSGKQIRIEIAEI